MERTTGDNGHGRKIRAWRRWSLALVLLAFICSGHWTAPAGNGPGLAAVAAAASSSGIGGESQHIVDCVVNGVLLTTDRSRFDVESLVPPDTHDTPLIPIECVTLDRPVISPFLSSGTRHAFLQVFRI